MQTIGERLEEARKRRGISIREAAEATKIRGDYLQKFESNQFDLNLADIYVRGFLRGYASFLKLPADKVLNDFKSLGLTTRPKAPSREVYGRMELSVSKSGEREEEEEPKAAEGGGRPAAAPARSIKRSASGMPPAPFINPDLVIRAAIGVGAVAVAWLVIWGVLAMFDSGETPAATGSGTAVTSSPAVAPAPAVLESVTFVATGPVTLQVWSLAPNGTPGEVLLNSVTLRNGESRVVPWVAGMYGTASARENFAVVVRGQRASVGASGSGPFRLPAP